MTEIVAEDVAGAHQRIAELEAEVDALRALLGTGAAVDGTGPSIDQRLADLEGADAAERLTSLEAATVAVSESVDQAHGEIAAVVEVTNRHQEDLAAHAAQLAEHQASLSDHGSRLDEQRATLDAQSSTLEDHGSAISDLEATSADHAGTLDAHAARLTAAEAWLAEVAGRSDTNEAAITSLDDAVEGLERFEDGVRTPILTEPLILGPSVTSMTVRAMHCSMATTVLTNSPDYTQTYCDIKANHPTEGEWTLEGRIQKGPISRYCRMICFGVEE